MKIFGNVRVKSAWRDIMHSTHKKISRGAENISRMLNLARKDNWRRNTGEFGRHQPKKSNKH